MKELAAAGGTMECLSLNRKVTNEHVGGKKHKVKQSNLWFYDIDKFMWT